jgi:hypothetical protein
MWKMMKLTVMLLALSAIILASTGYGEELKLEPSELVVSKNSEFNLSVIVNGTDIYAVQYRILFDPSVFEVKSLNNTTYLSSDGNTT